MRVSASAALCTVLAALAAFSGQAQAWSITITAASRRVYLFVGDATYDATNGSINTVQLTVPAASVGNGTSQAMTGNSAMVNSPYDNYATCTGLTPPSIMVGASYRRASAADGPASATLTVTSPANLVSSAGDVIPFSQISWTVAAPGSAAPTVIPAGAFTGGTMTLATIPANRYIENCHAFFYANSAVPPAGTYSGRVTYTVSSP